MYVHMYVGMYLTTYVNSLPFIQFYVDRGIEPDPHLTVYYEKLAQIQSHDSQLNPVVLQQVFSEVCVCVCVCVWLGVCIY